MDLTPFAYLGVIGLVLVALWYVRKGGSDSVKAEIGERDAKTAAKVADAVAAAPDSLSALRRDVQHGGKL